MTQIIPPALRQRLSRPLRTSQTKLLILATIFMVLTFNVSFFEHASAIYTLSFRNILFLMSLAILLGSLTLFLLSLMCFWRTTKPILIILLITGSLTSYFMNTYNVVINDSMINNVVSTNINESMDLLSWQLVAYLVLLGLLPSLLILRTRIIQQDRRTAILSRLKLSLGSLILLIAMLFSFGDYYASFFREHKPVRYYSNPIYPVYSTVRFALSKMQSATGELRPIGQDARLLESDKHRELVILVLGETARADRFSLNGYLRPTNPLLGEIARHDHLYSFTNFWSCATSTAESVPCMFSDLTEDNFTQTAALQSENVLDILARANTHILWLDNNSDSKGVALRVPYVDYRFPKNNPVCDIECRDIGMLHNLKSYIDQHPKGDILIVLHQMGNHGPAYYKRYPPEFEKFKPVCKTNQLEQCTRHEIDNAYDNAILYTDYFLSEVIKLLEHYDNQFEAAMMYVSDHGESLGENGLYLHGLPNILAPDVQRHVPFILWLNDQFTNDDINTKRLHAETNKRFSHDNIFHTLLGLFEVQTKAYDPSLDLIERVSDN